MGAIFMNFENKKTSYAHRLLLNHSDKINSKKNDKYVNINSQIKFKTAVLR